MEWELKRTVEQKKIETARNLWSQSGWWVWVSMVEKTPTPIVEKIGKDMF